MTPSTDCRGYDLSIIAGTGLALFAYAAHSGAVALALGCLWIAFGLYRYVPEDEHVLQGLVGLLAVILGGMAPISVLVGTPFGAWLVGTNPIPLAVGIAMLVVLFALVLRRVLPPVFESTDIVDPSGR
ncbi:hypothetical protein [Natrinema sp. 74]|uniref:hypothetical protein n=1 Tax=Natrinema sp. 74 TaxID=3384159 RepID=UPI0038D4DE44